MSGGPPRVLVLSASIGEGHDLPARILADGVVRREPDAVVAIADFLAIVSPLVRQIVIGGSQFHSELGNRMFDIEFRLASEVRLTRRLGQWGLWVLGHRRLGRAITRFAPDVVVSTYPGATELLGAMRERGRLAVPAVSAITDLAALRYWAHPGVDLHLITHPESRAEVAAIAPGSRIEAARGLNDPSFYFPRDQDEARRDLDLPAAVPIVLVSGGGWGVGDAGGATEAALAVPGAFVICLCGRNDDLLADMRRTYRDDPRVRVLGFSDRMRDLLSASDVLVHSTAGLTVLEAIICGTRVISYGWGRAHIRANNRAYRAFGLAEVVEDRSGLRDALDRALAARREPDRSFAELPEAAELVLDATRESIAG